jgi:hypothetical protein
MQMANLYCFRIDEVRTIKDCGEDAIFLAIDEGCHITLIYQEKEFKQFLAELKDFASCLKENSRLIFAAFKPKWALSSSGPNRLCIEFSSPDERMHACFCLSLDECIQLSEKLEKELYWAHEELQEKVERLAKEG